MSINRYSLYPLSLSISSFCFRSVLLSSELSFPEEIQYEKKKGKVRDIYITSDYVIIVATDRQSAFDRNLAGVPFKVSVRIILNMI